MLFWKMQLCVDNDMYKLARSLSEIIEDQTINIILYVLIIILQPNPLNWSIPPKCESH